MHEDDKALVSLQRSLLVMPNKEFLGTPTQALRKCLIFVNGWRFPSLHVGPGAIFEPIAGKSSTCKMHWLWTRFGAKLKDWKNSSTPASQAYLGMFAFLLRLYFLLPLVYKAGTVKLLDVRLCFRQAQQGLRDMLKAFGGYNCGRATFKVTCFVCWT